MPTPLELLRDPISITVSILYALLILVEALFPARRLPPGRHLCEPKEFTDNGLYDSTSPRLGDLLFGRDVH